MADVRQGLIGRLGNNSEKCQMSRFVQDVLKESQKMKQEANDLAAQPSDDSSEIETDLS